VNNLTALHLTRATEQTSPKTPLISLFLAYIAMLPLVACAALALRAPNPLLVHLATIWSGGLLCFFAGVRRGLSFRQSGGPTVSQLAGMLWLFCAGIATLAASLLLLPLIAFASMMLLDISATTRREAPRYFARLREVQLWLPILSLLTLILKFR
jgi:hypothetical protein